MPGSNRTWGKQPGKELRAALGEAHLQLLHAKYLQAWLPAIYTTHNTAWYS